MTMTLTLKHMGSPVSWTDPLYISNGCEPTGWGNTCRNKFPPPKKRGKFLITRGKTHFDERDHVQMNPLPANCCTALRESHDAREKINFLFSGAPLSIFGKISGAPFLPFGGYFLHFGGSKFRGLHSVFISIVCLGVWTVWIGSVWAPGALLFWELLF